MPPKLTVSDYVFYIVSDSCGNYRHKDIRGSIHRKRSEEFAKMMQILSPNMQELVIKLYGITNVQNVKTGEYTLVYDIFPDLRDEEQK